MGVYLFPFISATKLHFFLGVFLHFITGADSTEQGKKICQVIDDCCQRGSTILSASGGYCGAEKQVVMCACSTKEMYQVQKAVKEADPQSFLVVLECSEVHGEGFRTVQIGDPS